MYINTENKDACKEQRQNTQKNDNRLLVLLRPLKQIKIAKANNQYRGIAAT